MTTDEGLPTLAARIRSSTTPRLTVFTAQSKAHFSCRDAICEFVFDHDAVPLNPFRAFGYFLGDRVDRDLVRGVSRAELQDLVAGGGAGTTNA